MMSLLSSQPSHQQPYHWLQCQLPPEEENNIICMDPHLKLEDLAKKCGDFFKKLADYCYEYPKNLSSRKAEPVSGKQDKPKKNRDKKRKQTKPEGDVSLPKKPLTAYISYFQDHKQRFEANYPDLSLSALTKLIAKEWKEKTDEQKKPYLDKAENDRRRYEDELGLYEEQRKAKIQSHFAQKERSQAKQDSPDSGDQREEREEREERQEREERHLNEREEREEKDEEDDRDEQ